MSNKVFKNYQVNVGIPFQVKSPLNFHTIRTVNPLPPIENEDNKPKDEVDTQEIINDAQQQADTILKEAHYEALRIVENSEKEANESKIVILEEAWQKGYNEGLNEAKQQYKDLINEAEFIKENAKVEYKEVLAGIESDAVEVILEVARNVIGVEISFNKEDVLYLVKQAFEKCTNKEKVVLKISAEDYDYIIANKGKLLSMVEGMGELIVKKDTSLKMGACIVETPYGSIDAGVQTKLRKIEEAFRLVIGK